MILAQHPSEASGHWYDRNGNSVWEVPGAKPGVMVKPDIRHARKLGLLPGGTSIIKCAAAEALERWKQQQVLMAALTLPRNPDETDESFCERIMRDSQEQGRKAADRGTAIHAAIQGHYEGQAPDEEFWPYVRMVTEVVARHCGEQRWDAERSFGCHMGYGGKADLSCDTWLLDFKSKDYKDLDDPGKKLIYDGHAKQLAAYRRGLRIPGARCANVFVSRDPDKPVLVRFCEHKPEDLERGLQMFDHLLRYWQVKNRYDSSFSPLQEAA